MPVLSPCAPPAVYGTPSVPQPENMMLTGGGHVKLIDFGTCKDLIETDRNGGEFVGTAQYMSPQAVASEEQVYRDCAWHTVDETRRHALRGSKQLTVFLDDSSFATGDRVIPIEPLRGCPPVPDRKTPASDTRNPPGARGRSLGAGVLCLPVPGRLYPLPCAQPVLVLPSSQEGSLQVRFTPDAWRGIGDGQGSRREIEPGS